MDTSIGDIRMWILIAIVLLNNEITSLTVKFNSEGTCLDALEQLQQAVPTPVIGFCTIK